MLYSSDRCKKVFTNLPLVAYRRCKNISDILVRAKLPEPINTNKSRSPFGSFRCNKTNCTTCPFIEDGLNQYTFYSTGQTYQIKSHITCETSNVIYMIQCTKCNLQYIGETKRRLRPVPNVVLLPCRTQMNLPRQWHDDSTAAVSNVEPNTVVPNRKTKQTIHPAQQLQNIK